MDILKGNFQTEKKVEIQTEQPQESLESRFEREALKRVGGSIAFVSKKKVLWHEEETAQENQTNSTHR